MDIATACALMISLRDEGYCAHGDSVALQQDDMECGIYLVKHTSFKEGIVYIYPNPSVHFAIKP